MRKYFNTDDIIKYTPAIIVPDLKCVQCLSVFALKHRGDDGGGSCIIEVIEGHNQDCVFAKRDGLSYYIKIEKPVDKVMK